MASAAVKVLYLLASVLESSEKTWRIEKNNNWLIENYDDRPGKVTVHEGYDFLRMNGRQIEEFIAMKQGKTVSTDVLQFKL